MDSKKKFVKKKSKKIYIYIYNDDCDYHAWLGMTHKKKNCYILTGVEYSLKNEGGFNVNWMIYTLYNIYINY